MGIKLLFTNETPISKTWTLEGMMATVARGVPIMRPNLIPLNTTEY